MTRHTKTPKGKFSELPAALLTTCKGRRAIQAFCQTLASTWRRTATRFPRRGSLLVGGETHGRWEKKQQAIVTFGLIKAAN